MSVCVSVGVGVVHVSTCLSCTRMCVHVCQSENVCLSMCVSMCPCVFVVYVYVCPCVSV